MCKLSAFFVLSCALALALAEPRLQAQRLVQGQGQGQGLGVQLPQHPYLFLNVPRGRANSGAVVKGFEIVEQPDDDDDDEDDEPIINKLNNDDVDDDDDDDDDFVQDDDDVDNDKGNGGNLGLAFARNGQVVLLRNGAFKSSKNNPFVQDEIDSENDEEEANNENDDDEANEDDDDDDDDNVNNNLNGLSLVLAKASNRLPVGERLTRKAAVNGAANGALLKSGALNGGQLQHLQQVQQVLKTAKPTQMMVARDQAGAIMVPDGIIEIEGQSVLDEKTGKSALLVPRAALDAIPDGSVVALMERSAGGLAGVTAVNTVGEERANRVIVRRRRKGGRRNIQRRRRGGSRRRRGGNRRRRRGGNRRRNVRVVRGNRRVAQRRPVRLQG